jgi:hypothetical protein
MGELTLQLAFLACLTPPVCRSAVVWKVADIGAFDSPDSAGKFAEVDVALDPGCHWLMAV